MSEALVLARGVEKWFDHVGRRIAVLRGVDLTIAPGEMLAIVGRSGAGKSTMLHVLGALDLPSAGTIAVNGRDLAEMSEPELAAFRNRTMGFVFQFHHLLPELNALENVLLPGLIAKRRRAEFEPYARELLGRVGLGDRLMHHPSELSGGEQQRVAIARALLMKPRLVLADEPTGNLDGRTAEEIHALLATLNVETGSAFVVVTHSREFASRMHRVLVMEDGLLVGPGDSPRPEVSA